MNEAVAFANNDVSLIAWKYQAKIKDCLGFAIYRTDIQTGTRNPLPSWVGFHTDKTTKWKAKDTTVWPLQRYSWNDFTATRGKSYRYEIIPMLGTPDSLREDTTKKNRLTTEEVDLVPGSGDVRVYFNRGILSTQALTRKIPLKPDGTPDSQVLRDRIDQPGDPLRQHLSGQMIEGMSSLLERAKREGGDCYCALYELNDPELLKLLLEAPYVHIILSNTGTDDGTNKGARQALHEAGIDITDRMFGGGHIGHNKFVVYADKNGKPCAVQTGSTNWTYTGLCTQSNNTLVIESEKLARIYYDYWIGLKKDVNQQSDTFRAENNRKIPPVKIDVGKAGVWFSPNTKYRSKHEEIPSDLGEVQEAIMEAEKAVLFLAFKPGSPSIINYIVDAHIARPSLFVRGAVTDPEVAKDYRVLLFKRGDTDPDSVVAATAVDNQFSYWQKELLKMDNTFAIIHDKTVVIDPFSENCTVITGSHNLGNRASYCNDENLLIIRGNRELARMYAVHVMDIYNHYRWRYNMITPKTGVSGKTQKKKYSGLSITDTWQDRFYEPGNPASDEVNVWFGE